MLLLRLFYEFAKTGLFAVGGGQATIPFLTAMSDSTGWFTQAQLADMIAISESTPGPIGVNMATYVGYATAGLPGAVIATLGLITPSIIVVLIIARILAAFKDSKTVQHVFYGLRPASTGLIAAACMEVVLIALCSREAFAASGSILDFFQWKGVALALLLWVLTNKVPKVKDLHPAAFIGLAAIVGILFGFAG